MSLVILNFGGDVVPTLGKRIKLLRTEKQMTQEEIGEVIGVTKYAVSLYESDKSTPNDDIKKKLADFFKVSLDYLMGRANTRSVIDTIAAHHDGDDWTEEELESIEQFKEFVRMKREKEQKNNPD